MAGRGRVLPLDVVYEILLHLSAKSLCRLRAVCRPWRSLLSDPLFIAAHGARYPAPHLIASYADNADHNCIFRIVDPSGQIIKQIHKKEGDRVEGMAADLVCIKTVHNGRYRLLNPSTGAVYHLPDRLAQEHLARGLSLRDYCEPVLLFGQAAGKVEYKVLRMLKHRWHGTDKSLFEVCTLNRNRPALWRAKQAPPVRFLRNDSTRVAIDGVVYLLSVDAYYSFIPGHQQVSRQDWIVSFDLETEEWRPSIRGPSNLIIVDNADGLPIATKHVALTNLNGSLVIVHGPSTCVDMWFLMDAEEGRWVKQYSMRVEQYRSHLLVHPLLVLDDGRIVIFTRYLRLLQIYDPGSNTFTDVVRLGHCSGVSMYTGNLLSL